VAISGEVGLGKTTILRSYLERVDQRQLRTIYIFNANVSFRGLLKAIFAEFGLDYETKNLFEMVNHLHRVLIEEYKQGRNVALIIDEAQNMPVETLENLRMLSNLETSTEKLVQIILIGQPEFDQKLNLNELRQLKQRVVIRSTIEPLTPEESMAYIQHRLGKVALTDRPLFTKGAFKHIVEHAKGTPRVLNILCTNALIAGFGYRQKPITAKTVKEVIGDHEGRRRRQFLRPCWVIPAAVVVCTGVIWMSPYGDHILDNISQIEYVQNVIGKLSKEKKSPPSSSMTDQEGSIYGETSLVKVKYSINHTQDFYLHKGVNDEIENNITYDSKVLSEEDVFISNDNEENNPVIDHQEDIVEKDSNHEEDDKISAREKHDFPITQIIRKGDYVSKLAEKVYGFTNGDVIKILKEHNPQIEDMNKVKVGDSILFPELHVSKE
jgi:general secretion pathway protein A